MTIRLEHEIPRLTQDDFAQIAYRVVGTLFDIHADLGRLFDEKIYRRELIQRLPGAYEEVAQEVLFDSFNKRYSLDLLVAGAIFELKTVEIIVPRHRAQLLNYLLLADAAHGKIVNMRPHKVQHEFVNTSLNRTDRIEFSIDDQDWQERGNNGLKIWMIELLRDLGVGLDLDLYRDAALHFCSPTSSISPVGIYAASGHLLGTQEQSLLNPETAFRLSAIDPDGCTYFEHHLRRFLAHAALNAIQWINITRSVVSFKTIVL
jgi:GxxExxY protein